MTSPDAALEPRHDGPDVARVPQAPLEGLAVSIVSAAIVAALSVKLAKIIEPAIDQLITHPRAGAIWAIPLTIAGLAFARGVFQVIQASVINRIGNGVVGDMQVRLFGRLVRSDLAAPARRALRFLCGLGAL
jgi:subfamily B ATP-binding cassette protein MsbA